MQYDCHGYLRTCGVADYLARCECRGSRTDAWQVSADRRARPRRHGRSSTSRWCQGPGGFNKLVVVKELKPELVEEPAFLAMFLDEARLAARLSHPNIVQTNEVGNDGKRYFMAMDYLDGRGLDQIAPAGAGRRASGLSLPMHLRVVCDMLAGLDYAHKLTDFDGSPLDDRPPRRQPAERVRHVRRPGQAARLRDRQGGRLAVRDPRRRAQGQGLVHVARAGRAAGRSTRRADVFSAGVMLWEALTGKQAARGQERSGEAVGAGVRPTCRARRRSSRGCRPSSTRSARARWRGIATSAIRGPARAAARDLEHYLAVDRDAASSARGRTVRVGAVPRGPGRRSTR